MYRQELGNPFVDNFVLLFDHVNTFNYKVNDEIIIITNNALAFIIF